MFVEIGTVRNCVEAGDLHHLALFKDSISEIQLNKKEDLPAYFSPEYSHYLVAHAPFEALPSEYGKEWSMRFSSRLGVSIVERIGAESGAIYVKGLMAANGSEVYAVLPFTSIDAAASVDATFPDPRPLSARRRAWPKVLPELKGKGSWTSDAALGVRPSTSERLTPPPRSSGSTSTTPRCVRRG